MPAAQYQRKTQRLHSAAFASSEIWSGAHHIVLVHQGLQCLDVPPHLQHGSSSAAHNSVSGHDLKT